jgi:hypothetical protein
VTEVLAVPKGKGAAISAEMLRRWVRGASLAPSGDNCQPWSFTWDGRVLGIFHSEFRARHALNRKQHASLVSLGAVLENIRIAASSDGFTVETAVHWENLATENAWAEVRFTAAVTVADPLAEWIDRRATDRRRYRGGPIDAPCLKTILAETARQRGITARVVGLTPTLIDYIAQCESYVWTHPGPHRDLMRWLRFNRKEAQMSRDGMHWRNLGVNLLQSRALYLLAPWSRQRWANRMGFVELRQKLVSAELRSSAGVLAFTAKSREQKNLVDVGAAAQRAWLRLNAAGFGVQPLTLASLSVYDTVTGNMPAEISPGSRAHFEKGETVLRRELGLETGELAIWMFRFGLSSPLPEAARTLRRDVDSILSWLPSR